MFVVLCALAVAFITPPLRAQRQPVLQQIHVPHNYYYREMYLPQATSGPGWVTWSPDGSEVIYSMQGSLWRQKLGTDEAWQLTSGGGYDYQPDWSPDGHWVVFSSYRNDAMELRLLNLETRESRTLLADGAVNLEPRWSPDESRIAFVSTAYEGRWHVYTADFADGALKQISRITDDRDSQLPRYYYSRFDHYLSPTWSPDGKSLILVSNRDHIWGSGGFWKMDATPGAAMRQIHDEETTWKARPDWARDGRVVYSSYLGRQWNQLWLMTGEGANPFQLTFGDYDATNPRWSPDGRRIAYIANEHGNTELRIVTLPGSAFATVHADRRHYRLPTGRLRLRIVDATTGLPLPARVSVTTPEGLSLAPDSAWRQADDGFIRSERHFEYGYFHANGTAGLEAPAGRVMIEISHGPEYRVWRDTVTLTADSTVGLRVSLTRIAAPGRTGWTSGDLHVHMNYGGHYRATPATLAFQARAEGLNVVENLIVNKEGRVPDIGYFTGHPDPVSRPDLLIVHDQEYHTSYWGHTGILGLTDHVLLPGYSAYVNTPVASLYPDNAAVSDLAHRQGALFGYVHPFDEYPDPTNKAVPLNTELPVDVALGKVDYYEVMGFSDHLSSARVWYQLLNSGFRIPAGAGTDAMTNYASLRGPVGTARVYVHSGLSPNHRHWLDSLKAGRTFVTNGPLLGFSTGRTGIGGEIRLAQPGTIRFHVTLTSIVPVDHLEIVNNGAVVATVPLKGDRTRADTTITVPVNGSGWYALRGWSDQPADPILDLYPFSHTSPIYILVHGQPIRSRESAEYFLAWIGRLEEGVLAHTGWNSPAERDSVLEHIREARSVFLERR
jgi:TolB protein